VSTGSVGNGRSDGDGRAGAVGAVTVGAGSAGVEAITGAAVASGLVAIEGSGTAGALVVSEGTVVGFA
jgi:hypothetical protein